MSTTFLIFIVVASILLLLVLVIRFKLNAFVALLLVSIFAGLGAGMEPQALLISIQNGIGGILGFVAIVVSLGAIFGEMLEYSGGAQALANDLIGRFGEKRSSWALTITGFLVAIPVFFDVGFIILVPVIYALSRKTKKSMLYFAIPLLTGLGVTHAFIPPTPGPVAVTEILNADLGWVIAMGCLVGFPVAAVIGPLLGKIIGSRIIVHPPELIEEEKNEKSLPSFSSIFLIIAFPIVLIVLKSMMEMAVTNDLLQPSWITKLFAFVGHPFIALLLVTLISLYYLGAKRGASRADLLRLSTRALGPAGIIILITGAGGVFKQVLIDSGIGTSLAEALAQTNVPLLVLAFLIAAVVRVTQGSATVAMITAAGLISPITDSMSLSDPYMALIVLSIASGATMLSHVNDSGFWMVCKYLKMTEKQTIQAWTTTSTAIGIFGLIIILIIGIFITQ